MANVTGSIGDQNVVLENAATEATLKALLQAFLAKNSGDASTLKKIAEKVKLDTDDVEKQLGEVGDEAEKTGTEFTKTREDLINLRKSFVESFNLYVKQFTSGTATASSLFAELGRLPGNFGLLSLVTSKLLAVQEEYLSTYQKITASGANFAGNLSDMRIAAAQSYLSLEQFAQLVNQNTEAFSKMGHTVNDGVKSFTALSHNLIDGPAGQGLLSLGLTTEDLNRELAGYIAATGGRTKEELANTKAITGAAAEYITNLDKLTQYTGKSRKELEEADKKAEMNKAYQRKLASLDEAERAKLELARKAAIASGIKGADELVMSTALGLPPMTEAARQLQGVAGETANSFNDMTQMAMQHGTTQDQVMSKFGEGMTAAQKTAKAMAVNGDAIAMGGGKISELMNSLIGVETMMDKKGQDFNQTMSEITATQSEQAKSQAAAASQSSKAMQDLAANFNNVLAPTVTFLLKPINYLLEGFTKLNNALKGIPGDIIAAMIAWKAYQRMKGAAGFASGAASKVLGGGGGAAGGAGGVLGEVEKVGPGAGNVLSGLAKGLQSFANPMILLGATILAGSIAIIIAGIGAGIAAASWIMGKALPTLAEGLKKFSEVNGDNLKKVGAGLGILGLGLMSFIPFGIAGMPAVLAINLMANGLTKLAAVDPTKLERVAGAMKSIKDNTPGIGASISAGIFGLVSKVTDVLSPTSSATPSAAVSGGGTQVSLYDAVKELNNTSKGMLDVLNEIAGHSKRTGDAVKKLNNNNWAN